MLYHSMDISIQHTSYETNNVCRNNITMTIAVDNTWKQTPFLHTCSVSCNKWLVMAKLKGMQLIKGISMDILHLAIVQDVGINDQLIKYKAQSLCHLLRLYLQSWFVTSTFQLNSYWHNWKRVDNTFIYPIFLRLRQQILRQTLIVRNNSPMTINLNSLNYKMKTFV